MENMNGTRFYTPTRAMKIITWLAEFSKLLDDDLGNDAVNADGDDEARRRECRC